MDFGLKSLDDDQLVNLFEAMLAELMTRDGYVRKAAQGAIFTAVEQGKAIRSALTDAIDRERKHYINDLTHEIDRAVRKDVAEGKIKVVDLALETDIIVRTEKSSRHALVREMRKKFMEMKEFTLSVAAGGIVLKTGERCLNANIDQRTSEILARLGSEIADALGSYPRWMYRAGQGVIVNTPEELAKLGPGWTDSP